MCVHACVRDDDDDDDDDCDVDSARDLLPMTLERVFVDQRCVMIGGGEELSDVCMCVN